MFFKSYKLYLVANRNI